MTHPPVLLIVDDEPAVLDVVRRFGEQQGFRVVTCQSGTEGERVAREQQADAAVVDLRMPGVNGLEVLKALAEAQPLCRTILVTGHGSVETAVEALKLGALDYLQKPLDFKRLSELLRMVRDESERRRRLFSVEHEIARQMSCGGMVGRSAAMQVVFDNARRFAPHLRAALLVGEPGTGRQSLARVLHVQSARGDRPFVVVDCAMGDPAALEVHVFGASDSPGGHGGSRPGLVDQADGGVLYFDEITRLTAGAQSRLLRMLEHSEVLPVGGLAPHKVDVVVLAGATADPRKQAQAGRFRQDLLYRLAVVEFKLPPLRDRREDIPYLVAVFMQDVSVRLGKSLTGMAPDAEALLMSAPWQGNVRELQSVVERACLMADGPVVSARDLAGAVPSAIVAELDPAEDGDDGRPLSTVEREHIVRALQRAGGNKKAAARMLGVSRRALYRKLERLDLSTTISRRRRGDGGVTAGGSSSFEGHPSPARVASASK